MQKYVSPEVLKESSEIKPSSLEKGEAAVPPNLAYKNEEPAKSPIGASYVQNSSSGVKKRMNSKSAQKHHQNQAERENGLAQFSQNQDFSLRTDRA